MALRQRAAAVRQGTSSRPQGRPSDAQDAVGRDALIRAAIALLERLPPAKVTRAEVAREAGVDPSLIRYYFKDRASLLLAVLDQIVGERPIRYASQSYASGADALRAYVRGFFAFHTASPFFHRLLIEEIALSDSAAARAAFHRLNHHGIAGIAEILKEGVHDRSLRRADPVLLHIAIIGMCEFFFASGVLLEDALGPGVAPRDLQDRYGDLIVDLVLSGVAQR